MPALTDEEFAMLKADIAKRGVVVPIVLDDSGNILDGHNRIAAIAQLEAETPGLQIPYDTTVVSRLSEPEKRDYVFSINLKRRHLSEQQRLSLLVSLRTEGKTREEIAEIAGVSPVTVWRQLKDAETNGLFTQPEYVMGKDGKLRPTSYAYTSFMSHKELVKEERGEQRAIDRNTAATAPATTPEYDIFQADIRHSYGPIDPAGPAPRIAPNSLDAIITDPPYPQEYVHLMEDLAAFGAYALKPGRPLIAMLGHAYLPQYIELMSRHMTYHWIMADVLGGANATVHVWKAFVGWKPCLVFTNGKEQLPYYFLDMVRSPGPDKDFHVWGQDVQTFQLFTYRFTPPGGTVCDPFLGGGTTAVAALSMKRKFVGFDNDPVAIQTTLARLAATDLNDPLLRMSPLLSEEKPNVDAADTPPA